MSQTVATIRTAEASDRAALEACFIELQSFERSIERNRAEPQSICGVYIQQLFADCAKYSGEIFVAEIEARVVAFACVLACIPRNDIIENDKEFAYITDLIVLEPFRRSGIGAQLMKGAEAYARSRGATKIRVGVLAANATAHCLYHKLGYTDSEIILEKRLDEYSSELP